MRALIGLKCFSLVAHGFREGKVGQNGDILLTSAARMSPDIKHQQDRRISVLTCAGYWDLPRPLTIFFEEKSACKVLSSRYCSDFVGFVGPGARFQFSPDTIYGNQSDFESGGQAKHVDGLLQNAWGTAYAFGERVLVSDENNAWSTLYSGAGGPQSLQVIVSPASRERSQARPRNLSTMARVRQNRHLDISLFGRNFRWHDSRLVEFQCLSNPHSGEQLGR